MFPALMSDMFGNDDPFRQSMRQMDQMMNSVFGGGMPGPMGGMMMPFGGGMFDHFGSMMPMMNNQMNMMNNGHSQSFSSTTFMSYSSNGPNGQPQVYKESTSTRTGPGGIRETKKSVSDSRSGVKKMAIGHHIGDRGHIIERQQNVYSGEREENQELINLDDNEAEEFNNEWRKKAQNLNTHRNRYLPYTSKNQNSSHSLKKHHKVLPSIAPGSSGDVLASEQVKKRSSKQRSSKKSYKPTNDQ